MTKNVISQAGIFGFGPQGSEEVLASTFYRHKSRDIDLAPVDDVRMGPPEIGGVPVPTFPYKVGALAAGGATLSPRLEDTFGWLLYGAMGDVSTSGSPSGISYPEIVMQRQTLSAGAKTISTKLTSPTTPTKLIVRGWRDGSTPLTGNVVIHGTSSGSPAESVTLSDQDEVQTSLTWSAITSVDLPAYINNAFDAVSIGWIDTDMREHTFKFLAADNYWLPYMSFRKLIPAGRSGVTFGEEFVDCKVLGMNFQLGNEDPIAARVDVMGKTFNFVDDPAGSWTWGNTYETYSSIPLGCVPGGYIMVPSFGDTPLPITGATVGIQNAPLDVRQIRNFGSPFLDDIPIVTRQLVFDVTCKWYDPTLYRAIQTNSKVGTTWSSLPFVKSLDIMAYSPAYAPSTNSPYGLRIQSDSVLWQLAGGVRLAGNELVQMRLTGVAIDSSGNYASLGLINKKESYDWPS